MHRGEGNLGLAKTLILTSPSPKSNVIQAPRIEAPRPRAVRAVQRAMEPDLLPCNPELVVESPGLTEPQASLRQDLQEILGRISNALALLG